MLVELSEKEYQILKNTLEEAMKRMEAERVVKDAGYSIVEASR